MKRKRPNALIEHLRLRKQQEDTDRALDMAMRQSSLMREWWIKHIKPGKFPHESTRKA